MLSPPYGAFRNQYHLKAIWKPTETSISCEYEKKNDISLEACLNLRRIEHSPSPGEVVGGAEENDKRRHQHAEVHVVPRDWQLRGPERNEADDDQVGDCKDIVNDPESAGQSPGSHRTGPLVPTRPDTRLSQEHYLRPVL